MIIIVKKPKLYFKDFITLKEELKYDLEIRKLTLEYLFQYDKQALENDKLFNNKDRENYVNNALKFFKKLKKFCNKFYYKTLHFVNFYDFVCDQFFNVKSAKHGLQIFNLEILLFFPRIIHKLESKNISELYLPITSDSVEIKDSEKIQQDWLNTCALINANNLSFLVKYDCKQILDVMKKLYYKLDKLYFNKRNDAYSKIYKPSALETDDSHDYIEYRNKTIELFNEEYEIKDK